MKWFQLSHIHRVDILRHVEGIAIGDPVDTLEILQQLLPRHDVGGLLRVALIHLVQLLDANPVLNGPCCLHDALGIGLAVAHHLQVILVQALQRVNEGLLLLVGLSIVFLRQRGATMTCAYHILRCVKGVYAQAQAIRSGVESLGIKLSHYLQCLLAGLDGAYLLQIGQNRLIAHLVAAHAVHVEAIKRTDLLSVVALWQIFLVGILHDQRVDALLVQFLQIDECPIRRVLFVQRIVLQPRAHGILPEVVTGFHTLIKIRSKVLCHTCHTHEGED